MRFPTTAQLAELKRAYDQVKSFPDFKPGERAWWLNLRQAVGEILRYGPHLGPTLLERLRAADEDTVIAAFERSGYLAAPIETEAQMLELFNRMIDVIAGEA